jgi:hypothetical protein
MKMMKKRAKGGMVDTSDKEWDREMGETMDDKDTRESYSGDSNVTKESRGERKRGGMADDKKKDGKKRETEKRHERDDRKRGGMTKKMEGEAARPRLDRAKRKTGGGIGADHNPLSSAARTSDRKDSAMDRRSGGED